MKVIEELVVSILGEDTLSQKEVCRTLRNEHGINISCRSLRQIYESIRDQFANEEIDFTILHNAKGNYVSKDFDAIKKDNIICRQTAFAILKNAYARDKRIMNRNQMSFTEYLEFIEDSGNGKEANV